MYTVNQDDVHPVVGPSEVEGLFLAYGESGHGFKLGPAIGSMVAQAVTGNKGDFDTAIPLSLFSIDRKPIDLESLSVLA